VFYCGLAADAGVAAAIQTASATATVSSDLRPNGLVFFLRNSLIFIVLLLSPIFSHIGSIVGIDGVIFAGQSHSYTAAV
jgi:hypothetical protein